MLWQRLCKLSPSAKSSSIPADLKLVTSTSESETFTISRRADRSRTGSCIVKMCPPRAVVVDVDLKTCTTVSRL